MQTSKLDVLGIDILHELCDQLLQLDDGKTTLISFASTSKHIRAIAQRHLFRNLTITRRPASAVGIRDHFVRLQRTALVIDTVRYVRQRPYHEA